MRFVLALLLAALPSLAFAQSYGTPTYAGIRFGNPAATPFTGIGTTGATAAAGNDSRFAAAAQKGANTDITSLGGLTTPLSAAQGGTGASSLSGALDAAIGSTRATLAVRGAATWGGLTPSVSGCTFQFNGTDTVCATASPGTGALRYDAGQSLTLGQQDQVRVNVGGPTTSAPSSSATLAAADINRPLFPTSTITLTMPNGGAGWLTGTIKNANAVSGLVTLAVPSGATLDGTTNGTTVLNPYQRARVIQTGSTAYVTDWIDRTPIVFATTLAADAASIDVDLPVGYSHFTVRAVGILPATNSVDFGFRFSGSGAASLKSGSSDYSWNYFYQGGGTWNGTTTTGAYGALALSMTNSTSYFRSLFNGVIDPGTSASFPVVDVISSHVSAAGNSLTYRELSWATGATSGAIAARANFIRFLMSSGNIKAGASVVLVGQP